MDIIELHKRVHARIIIVELEEESQRLRDVLENVSCAGTLDEVSDALDKANNI